MFFRDITEILGHLTHMCLLFSSLDYNISEPMILHLQVLQWVCAECVSRTRWVWGGVWSSQSHGWLQVRDKEDHLNTLRPRRNEQHFADDIFKRIFFNENVWIPIEISLKFVPKGPINNIPALVQIMAWRRSGDKPLSEPMMVSLTTHICITRPQWVKWQVGVW